MWVILGGFALALGVGGLGIIQLAGGDRDAWKGVLVDIYLLLLALILTVAYFLRELIGVLT